MTDVVVERLRIRGRSSERLAQVAARHLPVALERTLGDLADVEIDRLEVRLDLDPSAYDEETLGVLWAEAIRTALLAAGARPRRSPRVGTGGDDGTARRAGDAREGLGQVSAVAEAALAWMRAGPASRATRVPRLLLALAEEAVAQAVAAQLGASEWRRLLTALSLALGPDPTTPVAGIEKADHASRGKVEGGDDETKGANTPGPHQAASVDEVPGSSIGSDDEPGAVDPRDARVLARLDTLADLCEEATEDVDLTQLTEAAGLALLWPWLGDLCRAAERDDPGAPPAHVRARALAHLADPDLPGLVDDPVVRLLAGVADADTVTPRETPDDVLAESAHSVLTAFARLLPGFGTSSSRFVRDEWVLRLGLLDRGASPVRLDAATHPLDVVLAALPYPLTLFKLPWSEPLSVRFRP